MDCDTWLTWKNFPTLVAAHQAAVRGPPVGRGPQVENRCLKSFHWLKILERIHFKVQSLTYNSLQSSQPTYLRERFTIQPTRSTRSSSCLTLSRPTVTSHLMFSNRAISIHGIHCTTSLEWTIPPEPRTISLPPPLSLPITRHQPPLSVTPGLPLKT